MMRSPHPAFSWQTGDGRSESLRPSWCMRFALLWSLVWGLVTPLAAQSGTHHAGLIIVHGDGHITTRCVRFSEDQINGAELLQRAGISWVGSSGTQGTAICSLEGEGCPASDCFCHCQGSPCTYWTYFHRAADGTWQYSGVGASGWQLRDGDVDGWVWSDGSVTPPAITLAEICAAAPSPTPRPTVVPTGTFTPPTRRPPTDVPSPTRTASPAAPPTPGETPCPTESAPVTPTGTPSPTADAPPAPPMAYGYFLLLLIGLALAYWRMKRR